MIDERHRALLATWEHTQDQEDYLALVRHWVRRLGRPLIDLMVDLGNLTTDWKDFWFASSNSWPDDEEYMYWERFLFGGAENCDIGPHCWHAPDECDTHQLHPELSPVPGRLAEILDRLGITTGPTN